MTFYNSKEEYERDLEKRAILPNGFSCTAAPLAFFPAEKPVQTPMKMNLALILAKDNITSFGAVFTQNVFCGAPVMIGKKRLTETSVRGILVNNKISNVCAKTGVEDAENILSSLGNLLHLPANALIPASTGIIGWQLPVKEIKDALPALVNSLPEGQLIDVARAIMTTDSFPKVRTQQIGSGRITAIAKGAGMIEPNMATMLVFILTDIAISRQKLQTALLHAADKSFNTISIDSDQSTSDTAICLSSGMIDNVSTGRFEDALTTVCSELAEDIVRNGEGTAHVIKVTVSGNNDRQITSGIGKAIINSPLVKTAIYGNDPNVGRLVAAIGDFLGNHHFAIDKNNMTISMGGIGIFSHMAFTINQEKETRLSDYLKQGWLDPKIKGYPQHDKTIDMEITIGPEPGGSIVIGSDLSYEYVRENADYRS